MSEDVTKSTSFWQKKAEGVYGNRNYYSEIVGNSGIQIIPSYNIETTNT